MTPGKKKRKLTVVVVKLSGSLFSSPIYAEVIQTLRNALNRNKELFLVLIAGGGATARKYIEAGSKLGLDQSTLDFLGIEASRLNACLLVESLQPLASRVVPKSFVEVTEQAEILLSGKEESTNRIFVCGGLQPGQSTNAVAALVAEKIRARLFINATDVEGVYDKDPNRHSDAILLDSVTPERLATILSSETMQAGAYDLIDPVALKLISRSKVPTRIIKCDPENLSKALEEKRTGTAVIYESSSFS